MQYCNKNHLYIIFNDTICLITCGSNGLISKLLIPKYKGYWEIRGYSNKYDVSDQPSNDENHPRNKYISPNTIIQYGGLNK